MPRLNASLISGLPLFAGLSPADLDFILHSATSLRYPKDRPIFEQDVEAQKFYLLLNGHIRVVRTSPEGHQIIARYINEGELFGIAIALGRATYPATAVAAVDCVALSWLNSQWAEFTQRFPTFTSGAYGTVGNRLMETQARVMEMSTEQVEQRIAHAILRLVHQSGRKTDEGIQIDFPITRQDIADMTGTTLHTVSRVLSAWESKGLISGGRQKVIVTDPHGLMLIGENRRSD